VQSHKVCYTAVYVETNGDAPICCGLSNMHHVHRGSRNGQEVLQTETVHATQGMEHRLEARVQQLLVLWLWLQLLCTSLGLAAACCESRPAGL
jgi:hypothetical protein